jgi:hypothetical protein
MDISGSGKVVLGPDNTLAASEGLCLPGKARYFSCSALIEVVVGSMLNVGKVLMRRRRRKKKQTHAHTVKKIVQQRDKQTNRQTDK